MIQIEFDYESDWTFESGGPIHVILDVYCNKKTQFYEIVSMAKNVGGGWVDVEWTSLPTFEQDRLEAALEYQADIHYYDAFEAWKNGPDEE